MSILLCGEIAASSVWHDTIANWLQGIGAILAVPGAFAAFWILFQRDEEKAEAVRQLAAQTRHLGDQVKAVTEQTAELRVQSIHMGNIHGVLAQVLMQNAGESETANEIQRLGRMPYLRNTSESFGSPTHATLGMFNSGGLAQSLEVKEVSDGVNLSLSETRVEAGKAFVLGASSQSGLLSGSYSFVIEFEDAIGLRYRQRFNASSINLTESQPERIEA